MPARSREACALVAAAMTNPSTPSASIASGESAQATPSLSATARRRLGIDVGDDEVVHHGKGCEGLGVEGADASDAGEADAHDCSVQGGLGRCDVTA